MLWIEWRSTFNLHNPAYTTVQSCSVTNGTEPTGSSEIQVLLHKWSLDSYTPNNKTSCKNFSQHSTQSCSLEIPTPIPTSVTFLIEGIAGKPAFGGLSCSGAPTTVHPRQRSHDGAPTTAWRHQCAARWHVCAGVCRKHRSVFASHAAVAGGYSHYNWKALVRTHVSCHMYCY